MKRELIVTEDGSHSIFVPELNEHYHSTHGAVQESMHVFIEAGLKPILTRKREINVLEIGLGTGLNAALSLLVSDEFKAKINYVGVEAYPLSLSEGSQLNFHEITGGNKMRETIMKIHSNNRKYPFYLGENFILNYLEAKLEDVGFPNDSFDLVYFDAFAPDVQPELWSKEIFEKLYQSMKFEGYLLTYSAKGEVRRNMKEVGFEIEKLPGVGGKREMTRAFKKIADFHHHEH